MSDFASIHSPTVWGRARHIFDRLLDVDEAARADLLKQEYATDPQVQRAVETLLQWDLEDGFLEHGWAAAEDSMPTDDTVREERQWLGRSVGPYQLTRELGRGGFGVVYLGCRRDGELEHEVAVKVLDRAMEVEGKERFLRERQILARLEHPNICRFLDGGTTDDGVPYAIMERVKGRPLLSWCDEQELSIENRLQLFLNVTDAVSYAHRNLVVHRDLKPSNILVTEEGAVKLLDFGIAKLMVSSTEEPEPSTTRWMTPPYASPEQILGGAITTSSDVYSLAVLLCELLSGFRPYPGSGWVEKVRGEPPRGPVALLEMDHPTKELKEVSRRRRLTPAGLRWRLAGDLDHIVRRALELEPEQRWGSVEEMAADLRRHLEGRPVTARSPTFGYRLGKFARRHAPWVATMGALLLLVLGLAMVAAWQGLQRAEERDRALQEKAKAETVAKTLAQLFRSMDSMGTSEYNVAAKDLLDRGALRVERVLEGQPEVQATLFRILGETYAGLGFPSAAEELLLRSGRQFESLHGPRHLNVAHNLRALAQVRLNQGWLDESQGMLRHALAIYQMHYGREHPDIAQILRRLGELLIRKGDFAGAEVELLKAMKMRSSWPEPDLETGHLQTALGFVDRHLDHVAAAEEHLVAALESFRFFEDEQPLNVPYGLNNLAALAFLRSDFEQGAQALEESLSISRQLRGDEHPDVQIIRSNLAAVFHQLGRREESEVLYRESLAISVRLFGREHPDVALVLNNLGRLLAEQDRLEESQGLLREALVIRRRILDEDHPDLASTLNNLGLSELAAGHPQRARTRFEEALNIARKNFGEHHRMVGISLTNRARAALHSKDFSLAEHSAAQAIEVLSGLLPSDHWRLVKAREVLAAAKASEAGATFLNLP